MVNAYGLTESDMAQIVGACGQFEEIAAVVLFGSRAKGNYKPGSDVDLAVKGDRITRRTIAQLADLLNEELPLLYFFDVVHYSSLDQPLADHIDRVGVVLYDGANAFPQTSVP
ncbi:MULTISPECIES: nucleotidyltransferase domain-containing protein [Cyanophyceae]|uniref:nucleotidyltransferase domain-containing protein n=1 Tax=Cyanophyceae TaxID=3028117 RepID=UPI001688C3A4|nr:MULTISPECIES: nucleotidyltransferase domain-containing protein [Cyanophyceae]MBD1916974.1 nucleotidyltransferase domain-containing protein [Phormidium sp. FACHB-77]MBD2029825.1 nucleotidyltransferase domain-containing protein [Phormidium sp. FACHB-322]MBD2050387.1 nucleotidyltransferase domain-containing protein [Leptolyngbya sp. FACHB-60]